MMWSIIQHYRLVNLFDEPPAQQPNTSAPSTSSGAVAAKQGETREEQQRTSAKSDDGAQKSDKAAGVKDGSPQAAGEAVSPSAADERAVENKGDKKADVKAAKKDDKKKDKDSKKEKKLQAKEEKATAKKDVKKAKAEPAAAAAAKQTETARPSSAVGAEKARETTGAGGQPAIKAVTAARQPQQSVESSLLEWVRDKLADAPEGEKLQVNNVKELFADGRALPVLVNTIQPGTECLCRSTSCASSAITSAVQRARVVLTANQPSYRLRGREGARRQEANREQQARPARCHRGTHSARHTPRSQTHGAHFVTDTAATSCEQKLAVPALIEGDDLANGADVDGLSLILYLSYLKQADAHKVQAKEEANHAKQEATAAVETKAIEPASVHISDGEEKSKAGGNVIEKERNETKRDEATTAKTESEAETKTKTMEQANVIKNEEGKSKAEAEALTADAAAVVAVAKENVPETAGEALAPSSDGGDSKHAANKRPSSSQDFDAAPAAPTSDEREVKTNERVETIASKPSHEESEQQREAATNAHDEKSKKEEKKKKDKKKKKTKKSKKGKDAGGEDNNKKKKKTKASSKAVSAPVPAVKEVEPTTASTPDSAPSGKEAPAPAAKKALAPLPHSRLPSTFAPSQHSRPHVRVSDLSAVMCSSWRGPVLPGRGTLSPHCRVWL
jgi:hypothetical protein